MKRLMVIALLGGILALGTAPAVATPQTKATAAAADRVRCDFRGDYRIVCYNNTPYIVHMRLNLFTNCGLRIRYFTIFGYSRSVYSNCYINRITWRWWF